MPLQSWPKLKESHIGKFERLEKQRNTGEFAKGPQDGNGTPHGCEGGGAGDERQARFLRMKPGQEVCLTEGACGFGA